MKGDIIVNDIKVNDPKTDLPKLRSHVGMVFQNFELFPHLTITQNLTLGQILKELAAITGGKAPTVELPYFVAYTAGVVTTAWARITGIAPRAPLEAVRMAKKKMWVTHEKATRELGYCPQPARTALTEAAKWFEAA